MIFGDCPYCGEVFAIACAAKCPAFSHETCEKCGKTFWEYHSRIEPTCYTEEEFAAKYTVDEATKKITEKLPAV